MKTGIITLAILLSFGCTLRPYAYTKKDALPIAIMTAAIVADAVTSDRAMKRGATELHPVLGEKPSTETLIAWGIANEALMLWIGRYFPYRWRMWLFGAKTGASVGAAVHNSQQ